ncbi:MAG: DNA/RNA nuclease SfsA [Oceanospirillaceae bacterium]
MQYDKPLVAAVLIKRYKRFLADVRLINGEEITVHCANTGAMTGCAIPGSKVWLYKSDNLKRKYSYSWELVELEESAGFICINTARPNQIIEQALIAGKIAPVKEYKEIKREVKYATASRVDFFLSGPKLADVYLEVKSVTLHLQKGLGAFPDAVTVRGQKHLCDLLEMKKNGARSILVFCVLHSLIKEVTVADFIDAKYGQLLREVVEQGVEVYCYSVDMSVTKLSLNDLLPLRLDTV